MNWFKNNKTKGQLEAEDFVIRALKNKFLSLASKENYPRTPELTKDLDYIVETIREMEAENLENEQQ
jgi:hypothetical protein